MNRQWLWFYVMGSLCMCDNGCLVCVWFMCACIDFARRRWAKQYFRSMGRGCGQWYTIQQILISLFLGQMIAQVIAL